jgi:tetratricopeptide (TPR) repeat protein
MNYSPNLTITLSEVVAAEENGQYEKAFRLLTPFWSDFEQFPNTIGLSGEQSAEVFLRLGGVIGFLGNTQRISNSQEISKNLLTQARQRFLSLSIPEKIAECENYLALAYSRTGEFTEAFDWLNESLSRNLTENHPTRLNSYVIEALLDMDAGKFEKILRRGNELREVFEKHASYLHKGCFYNHLAIAYKTLGNDDEALIYLKTARDLFQKADHEIFYGATENNLAQLYHKIGLFPDAHACAQKARTIFEQMGDKMREGFCLETQAQIFAAQGKPEQALISVNQAIELLENGEGYRKLVDSYRTKVKILILLDRLPEALTVMTAAHNLAALYISQTLSREIIEDVAAYIEARN